MCACAYVRASVYRMPLISRGVYREATFPPVYTHVHVSVISVSSYLRTYSSSFFPSIVPRASLLFSGTTIPTVWSLRSNVYTTRTTTRLFPPGTDEIQTTLVRVTTFVLRRQTTTTPPPQLWRTAGRNAAHTSLTTL